MRQTKTALAAFIFLCVHFCTHAQCIDAGTANGTIFSNDNSTGSFAFSNPAYAGASDNNRASASAILSVLNGSTNLLTSTSFGFSIPTLTSICGIRVDIQKRAQNISILAWVTDKTVTLMKNGVSTGTNKATGTVWTSSDVTETYGGSSDLWGTTWTIAEINATGFGVGFAAQIKGLIALLPSAQINQVQVTVYYAHIIVPIVLMDFREIKGADGKSRLQWTLAPNDQPITANILMSKDNSTWKSVYAVTDEVNTASKSYEYRPTDCQGTTYYKLHLSSKAGDMVDSKVVYNICSVNRVARAYPVPARDFVIITNLNSSPVQITNLITLLSADGRSWQVPSQSLGDGSIKLNLQGIPRGYFIVSNTSPTVTFLHQ